MPNQTHKSAINALEQLLGSRLSTKSSILKIHGCDEAYTTPARPDAVAFPNSTIEVAEIVKICVAHSCPMVAFGVGTSLEGHVVPTQGGISIDTSHINKNSSKSIIKISMWWSTRGNAIPIEH